jgi:peptidoglycan/xylan/chitin deacetylase (PgdA/CDA1 family)
MPHYSAGLRDGASGSGRRSGRRRGLLKNLAYKILGSIRKSGQRRGSMLALMYHEVLDDAQDIEAWTVVKRSEFEKQLVYLGRTTKIISLEEALRLQSSGEPLEDDYTVITFDDGYAGNFRVAYPLLQKYGVPATIYVATKACRDDSVYWYDTVIEQLQERRDYRIDLGGINGKSYRIPSGSRGEAKWTLIQSILQDLKQLSPEARALALEAIGRQAGEGRGGDRLLRHLNLAEIAELSRSPLVTLGAHSHCHSILPGIPVQQASASVLRSKQLLEQWSAGEVSHFSYPNGDYNEAVLKIVRDAGFLSSVTTRAKYWRRDDSPFEIPRLGVGRYDSLDKLAYMMAGIKR